MWRWCPGTDEAAAERTSLRSDWWRAAELMNASLKLHGRPTFRVLNEDPEHVPFCDCCGEESLRWYLPFATETAGGDGGTDRKRRPAEASYYSTYRSEGDRFVTWNDRATGDVVLLEIGRCQ